MKFIGIDFGWEGKPSGLAALQCNAVGLRLAKTTVAATVADVLKWVDEQVGTGDAIVAVDAPLVIANDSGMRPVDREISQLFGRYHAGVYPVNLSRPCAARTLALAQDLTSRGFQHTCSIQPRVEGRYMIEVYPHAATVNLFRLNRIIKYKKGRVEQRRQGLSVLRSLLIDRMPNCTPCLEIEEACPSMPVVGGRALKAAEDQLDAIICAYVGAHWWYWGSACNTVYGDSARGYIVVPNRRESNSNSSN